MCVDNNDMNPKNNSIACHRFTVYFLCCLKIHFKNLESTYDDCHCHYNMDNNIYFDTISSSEEKDDKKQALAASMATFFHLVGFSSIRGGNLLESFPSFVSNKIPSKLKKV